jgi:xanthine dehydrogenase molybdopterin-binding subunit B
VYANGGAAIDLSYSILAETINHLDNCYNVPHFRAVGKGSALLPSRWWWWYSLTQGHAQ